ncbi:MAG: hypothetical protein HKN68_06535 [Saprospiraceae bacterium]|nr:hypothetical protein [Saprospiraceae bacterium]
MESTGKEASTKKLIILLILGIILFVFSNGNWPVSIATWLAPVFLLRFSRSISSPYSFILLFLVISVATGFMYYGIIPSHLGILTYILILYYAVLWFLPFVIDRLLLTVNKGFLSTLIFPSSMVFLEYVNNLFFGSWASVAYSQFNNLPLIQIASVFGIWGITFIVMWFGSFINWVIENNYDLSRIRKGITIYTVVLISVLIYGGIRLDVFPPDDKTVTISSFTPQDEIDDYINTLNDYGYVSTLQMARSNRDSLFSLQQPTIDKIFKRNKNILTPETNISIWPEGLISVLEEYEEQFISQGRELAKDRDIYLLLGYILLPEENPGIGGENKAVLINPSGEVEWEYLKTHPVPGATHKPGDGILPVTMTPFGNISTVICYDMDFTALLNSAGSKEIDIMLVPAWDWKAIDPLHARMAVFRAIENGFSMVRQTGEGLSIAVDYQGRTLALMDHFTSEDRIMVSNNPTQGVRTVYSYIGDLLPWVCMIFLILSMVWKIKKGKNSI